MVMCVFDMVLWMFPWLQCEALQQELEQSREKCEELQVDLEILKNEISDKGNVEIDLSTTTFRTIWNDVKSVIRWEIM